MKVLGNRNLFLLVSVAVSLTLGFYGPANADEMSELSELRTHRSITLHSSSKLFCMSVPVSPNTGVSHAPAGAPPDRRTPRLRPEF